MMEELAEEGMEDGMLDFCRLPPSVTARSGSRP